MSCGMYAMCAVQELLGSYKMQRIKQQRHQFEYDRWVLFVTLAIAAFGLLMVASASMVISDKFFGYPFHYLVRQSVFLLIGACLSWGVTRIPLKLWQQYSGHLMLLSLLLLVAVLVPGISHVVNGSRRWISFGIVALQVSEVVKFSFIIYLSSYLFRYQNQVQTELKGFLKPLVLLGVVGILLLMEPDFGSTAVISMTALAMLFIAGVRLWPFLCLFASVAGAMAVLAITSPYRLLRLTTFLNPWHTAFGSGYQLTQSLIAFGRGGLFGVGLGNSVQKLFYLPEAHTDFIFAVTTEELGFIGALFLIALFVFLITRIFKIGKRACEVGNVFGRFVCYGSAFWLSLQMLINIGVNTGVLPTKGLTLPFISYGGSSLLVNCVLIGIILRVAYETSYSS